MSLIRVRRSRKKSWIDTRKGFPVGKLVLVFAFVIALMWYLGSF